MMSLEEVGRKLVIYAITRNWCMYITLCWLCYHIVLYINFVCVKGCMMIMKIWTLG